MKYKESIKHFFRQSKSDMLFDIFNVTLMVLLLIIFLWPLIFVLSASVSDPAAVITGKVLLLPVEINLDGYKAILEYDEIWIGYKNTIVYTVVGTIVNLIMTICAAYPLSRKEFVAGNFLTAMFMFTMFFSGGLIPTYLVVVKLGLIDTIWAMILPGAVSVFYVIIMRTYFQTSIPQSLYEAAELDGATPAQILMKIVLPLSTPIIAVMALYYGVAHWNSFFDAMIYMVSPEKYPIQMFLRDILIENKVDLNMIGLDPAQAEAKRQLAETIKYGVIVVASVPILCFYPFVQKYFVKGVMIGAVKG